MSMYGVPGSGKTYTALLFAEGIAKKFGKRIAYADTERGTDFYAMRVLERKSHPEPFDFDAIYTRSITEILKSVKSLDPKEYCVVVLDSMSHLWEAAIGSYTGPKTSAGTIPMWAWGKIKAPYKELMKFLIDSPFHVFLLGRQANVFEEDEVTGEVKAKGVKMRAEGETAYEPHVCIHMHPIREPKTGTQTICAFAEKDRSGILGGKRIEWPNYEKVIAPLMGIMGKDQASTPSDEDAAQQDSEAIANAEREKIEKSASLAEKFKAKFVLAEDLKSLEAIGKQLTPEEKKKLMPTDHTEVRKAYLDRKDALAGMEKSGERATRMKDAAELPSELIAF